MRNRWMLGLFLTAGCTVPPAQQATQQVPAAPFTDPRGPIVQTKVTYTAATQDTSYRVELVRAKLVGENTPAGVPYVVELIWGKPNGANPQAGLKPIVTAIGSPDPEVFHTSANQIYITEGLVRQCQTDGQLAAVLANELGRIVSEREASVGDQARNPPPPLPIYVPIGGGSARDADPTAYVQLAQYDKAHPKQLKPLLPPNPQQVARSILERAGFERTELDAVQPILQNAERYRNLENQFKGTPKQGDWKAP